MCILVFPRTSKIPHFSPRSLWGNISLPFEWNALYTCYMYNMPKVQRCEQFGWVSFAKLWGAQYRWKLFKRVVSRWSWFSDLLLSFLNVYSLPKFPSFHNYYVFHVLLTTKLYHQVHVKWVYIQAAVHVGLLAYIKGPGCNFLLGRKDYNISFILEENISISTHLAGPAKNALRSAGSPGEINLSPT